MHKPQGWSKADHFVALLQSFVMVKLEVPGRALSPGWDVQGAVPEGGSAQAAGPCLWFPALFSKLMPSFGFHRPPPQDRPGGEE